MNVWHFFVFVGFCLGGFLRLLNFEGTADSENRVGLE